MKKIISISSIIFFLMFSASLAKETLVLNDKSYGPVTFGAELRVIEKKIGIKAKSETGETSCDFVTFENLPGIQFMVEEGVVTRADAISSEIQNKLQIAIGTSLQEVKRRYPEVAITRHHYDPDGHYLIFKSKDRKSAIVFEEGSGKVTAVRAGLEPSVEYIEGCL